MTPEEERRNQLLIENFSLIDAFLKQRHIPRAILWEDIRHDLAIHLLAAIEDHERDGTTAKGALSTYFWRRTMHRWKHILARHMLIYAPPSQLNRKTKQPEKPELSELKYKARSVLSLHTIHDVMDRLRVVKPRQTVYDHDWDDPEHRHDLDRDVIKRALIALQPRYKGAPSMLAIASHFLRDHTYGWQKRFAAQLNVSRQRAEQLARRLLPDLREEIKNQLNLL